MNTLIRRTCTSSSHAPFIRFSQLIPPTFRPPLFLLSTQQVQTNTSNLIGVRHIFVPLNSQEDVTLNITSQSTHNNNADMHHAHKRKEITIYIKGFLAKGETPEEFEHWFKCHQQLSSSTHEWGPLAHGYYWKAGHASWDKYIPYGTLVYSAFNLITKKRIPLTPAGLVTVALSEAALVGGRLWYEFRKAHETARENAPTLAKNLLELGSNYSKIRCVAHSLGCVLLLESLKTMPPHLRPHEVHLLAPALTEEHLFNDIAKEQAYLYHCDRDLILTAATALHFLDGEALGLSGPHSAWQGLTSIDVSNQLGFFVHREYRDMLHKIAADHKIFMASNGFVPEFRNDDAIIDKRESVNNVNYYSEKDGYSERNMPSANVNM